MVLLVVTPTLTWSLPESTRTDVTLIFGRMLHDSGGDDSTRRKIEPPKVTTYSSPASSSPNEVMFRPESSA